MRSIRTGWLTVKRALPLVIAIVIAGCGDDGRLDEDASARPANATAEGADLSGIAGAPDRYAMDADERRSAREWYLDRGDGCQLYVREFGVGDTVVVLHGGWGAEHSYLLTPFRGLEDDHHLVFYDQRGSLRSPCPDSTISVEAHVSDLERLRLQLGQERLTLAGHSMGTWLAMKYLETHPERVGGMVLLNSLVPRIGEEDTELYGEEQRAFSEWRNDSTRVQEVLESEDLDRPVEELGDAERTDLWRIRFANANIFRIDRWRQMEGGQAFYDQSAGSAAGESMNTNAGWDFLDDLAGHPYPVTVVIGDHDLVGYGGRLHRRQLEPLDHVTFAVLEEAGHNGWVDRPVAYREALNDGLARAVAGPVAGGTANADSLGSSTR